MQDKIDRFARESKKWKDLSEILEGFTAQERKIGNNFETLKNGEITYKKEFLAKFLGGLEPEELERKSLLFCPDGT